MDFPIVPFVTFSIVTIFTPGPNNISSMSFGIQYGYRGTVKYLLGILVGAFAVFMGAGFFSTFLSRYLPAVFPYLKYLGAGYIVFLGVQVIRSSFTEKEKEAKGARFYQGILLQFLNIKGMIYCITVFTVFIHPYFESILINLLIAGILLVVVFFSISLYTLGGNIIQKIIRRRVLYIAINIVMALGLFYSAAAIILSDL